MRIAHVANFYGPTSGGLRTAMHAIGKGYRDRGHEVLLVVPSHVDADEETPFGRRVSLRAPLLPFSGGYRVIREVASVQRVLNEFRPDRLEVSDRSTLRGLGPWARSQGIPAIFFNHERVDGLLRANLPRGLASVLPIRAIANAHNRGTARRFDAVVCTTEYAAEEFARIGHQTVTIPLGVDLDHFCPARRDPVTRARYAFPDEHLIVMASRLSKEKRPDIAIEAVRLLTQRGLRVRLISAGGGNIAPEIAQLAEGLPVTFLGFISGRDEYADLLAAADVIVAPGPIETFGLAALEGLASGTPAVVNALSALPEVVGSEGEMARSTPEGFADAIVAVLSRDPAEARRAARKRAELFPWSRTVDRLLELHGAPARVRKVREGATT